MDAVDLAYRVGTLDVIVGQAQADLAGVWQSLLSDPVERAAAGMREVLPEVAREYGAIAADNAVIWYEDLRPTRSGWRPRSFTSASMSEAVGKTTWAVTPLFTGDEAAAWERIAGTLQKLVIDHDRATVDGNVTRDPAVFGWRRQASADACAYCAYMAVVLDQPDYDTDAKKYHDHCRCVPVMHFRGETIPAQPNEAEWSDTFEKARQLISDEQDRARAANRHLRRSQFLRKHPHLSLTTKNILARARRLEPDLFRDGVRAA